MAFKVEAEIHRRITEAGKITFAEFMDLALYWPRGGYYATPGRIGPKGDFYTGPSAHPAFGALLCVQLFQMWQLLGQPSTFWVVDLGAGSGLLCQDVLSYASNLSDSFAKSMHYLCLDRYPAMNQAERVPGKMDAAPYSVASDRLPLKGVVGCILSNELVDSLSVHRITIEQGALKEVYVTLEKSKYMEVLDTPSTPLLAERLQALGIALPEEAWAEINLAMEPWLQEIVSSLKRGFVLTIDYGHLAPELYSPARRRGTLVTCRRHIQTDNPYSHVGQQDITAQVDFTTLMKVGRNCGLKLHGFTTQRGFFNQLGLQQLIRRLPSLGLEQGELEANRMSMLDIIRPEGMADFKVLAQSKGIVGKGLWGFDGSSEAEEMVDSFPVPLLTSRHMPLLEGRYPHLSHQWKAMEF